MTLGLNQKGFTFIELSAALLVISLIALLPVCIRYGKPPHEWATRNTYQIAAQAIAGLNDKLGSIQTVYQTLKTIQPSHQRTMVHISPLTGDKFILKVEYKGRWFACEGIYHFNRATKSWTGAPKQCKNTRNVWLVNS